MTVITSSSDQQSIIIKFLTQYERSCVTLISHVITGELIPCVVVDKEKIRGVISVSPGGQILHCLPDFFLKQSGQKTVGTAEQAAEYQSIEKFFTQSGRIKNLFSILGERGGTRVIAAAIEKAGARIPVHQVEYELMEYDASHTPSVRIPQGFELLQCTPSMTDELFPLQEGFEKEEVLFEGHSFDPALARYTLEHTLKTQTVCALIKTGVAGGVPAAIKTSAGANAGTKVVAKAGTNATGKNYVQIGGVYTVPSERGHGYAGIVVSHLARLFTLRGKKIVLFVKETNKNAQQTYKKAGFSGTGYFSIYYY